MGAYDLGELGPAQVASSGLQGLLEAYKMKMAGDVEQAKMRQSGFNAGAAQDATDARLDKSIGAALERERIRAAADEKGKGAREEEIGGIRYLVRMGGRGQEIWTPVMNQKGSAAGADSAQGNIASINQAPEYLKALKGVPGGNLGIRATQTAGIGSIFGLLSKGAANAREKRKAFITPYLSAGGGKALTEGERKIFEGRVNESSLVGDGTHTQGIQDLTQEIAAKTGSAIDTNAMGPATPDLRTALNAAIVKAREGGALPAAAAPGGDDFVRVISPNGTPGRIPRAKLDEKLKGGYRLAP